MKVASPAENLAKLKEPRRSEVAALRALIRKTAPKLELFIYSDMLGYGHWHYKYASGREGESCRIGLASHANYISLYICACDGNQHVPEKIKKALPKAKIGKACVQFKKLADMGLETHARTIWEGAEVPAKA